MPKATGHALITFCNSCCHFFRSSTIVCLPNFCQSSATFSSHALGEKTRPNVHKPKHSIDNTPAPSIVHIGITPWPHSRQPFPSSQTTKPFKIHDFRPVLPSSFCISLRPARRAVSSRRNPMSKDRFLHQHVRQIPQAGCTRPPTGPQQRHCRVSTESDRNFTDCASLEPVSVVRFARYCGRRHHSPQQPQVCTPCRSMFRALKPSINAHPATYSIRTPVPTQ